MRNYVLVALTILSLTVAAVPSFAGSTVEGDRAATLQQQTGTYGGG